MSATKGVHCQVSSAATVATTVLGSDSHKPGGRPMRARSQLAMPKLGSRMTIAIMPTTTGGSMKGDTITVRTSPRAKLVRASEQA